MSVCDNVKNPREEYFICLVCDNVKNPREEYLRTKTGYIQQWQTSVEGNSNKEKKKKKRKKSNAASQASHKPG
jgi:anaerobic ribonucleoside-triphosphate reductase